MVSGLVSGMVTGNSVLTRCPDSCVLTGLAVEELGVSSGLEMKEHQVILSEPGHTDLLLAHPHIQHVRFIGSASAGREIAVRAASHGKSASLQTGGSNAVLVTETADIALAVESIVRAKCVNSGQHCLSP